MPQWLQGILGISIVTITFAMIRIPYTLEEILKELKVKNAQEKDG